MTDRPIATVAILTYTARTVERILSQLRLQEVDGEFEVLVIDSGRRTRPSRSSAASHEVRLHEIPNEVPATVYAQPRRPARAGRVRRLPPTMWCPRRAGGSPS